LKSDSKYYYPIGALSLVLSGLLAWRMGYRDWVLISITIGGALLLYFFGLFLFGILVPPVYKRVEGGKAFDKTPSLFVKDKPGAGKKTNF